MNEWMDGWINEQTCGVGFDPPPFQPHGVGYPLPWSLPDTKRDAQRDAQRNAQRDTQRYTARNAHRDRGPPDDTSADTR